MDPIYGKVSNSSKNTEVVVLCVDFAFSHFPVDFESEPLASRRSKIVTVSELLRALLILDITFVIMFILQYRYKYLNNCTLSSQYSSTEYEYS